MQSLNLKIRVERKQKKGQKETRGNGITQYTVTYENSPKVLQMMFVNARAVMTHFAQNQVSVFTVCRPGLEKQGMMLS